MQAITSSKARFQIHRLPVTAAAVGRQLAGAGPQREQARCRPKAVLKTGPGKSLTAGGATTEPGRKIDRLGFLLRSKIAISPA
jgi:hypothetical protein